MGTQVKVQLVGDLRSASSPLPAAAWLDRQLDGRWRTVYWLGGSVAGWRTMSRTISRDSLGPDADVERAGVSQPLLFNLDDIGWGAYRICRTIPQLPESPGSQPPFDTAYVCASLAIEHPSYLRMTDT